jgi:hypothetical protein
MAQDKAGKVSNITPGQSVGGTKDAGPGRKAGTLLGLAGSAGGTGPERIRDVPLLTRDEP